MGLIRWPALLKISGTVGAQPPVDAVVHSLAILLSNVVSFDDIALLLFDPCGQRLARRALEGSHDDAASTSVQKSCTRIRGSDARLKSKSRSSLPTSRNAELAACLPRTSGSMTRVDYERSGQETR